ncbi:hypothetical protein Efla_000067 [Eimeria flavescens]
MGFLGIGEPLGWAESLPFQAAIKRRGIRQFLQLLKQFKDYQGSVKWGDEIEVFIVRVDEKRKEMRLALEAGPSILEMQRREAEWRAEHQGALEPYDGALWQPEYASYMIEALPGRAADLTCENLGRIEHSLRSRRRKLLSWLGPHIYPLFLTAFPLLGVDVLPAEDGLLLQAAAGSFSSPPSPADPLHSKSKSIFVGDKVINTHPRFGSLTANIRRRRGRKVEILIPLYLDEAVEVDLSGKLPKEPLFDARLGGRQCILYKEEEEAKRKAGATQADSSLAALHKDPSCLREGDLYIYMDAMCFGMGMNCVQATFSCVTISDARYLYDQLIVMAPLLLSLTAATPFLRGCVAATDTRWDVISMSVDSRKEEEKAKIIKSRYSSNSLYISERPPLAKRIEELNNLNPAVNERAYDALIRSGVDPLLAKHVALLFVHDPLVIFRDRALKEGQTEADIVEEGERDWGEDDGTVYDTTEDFENIQSTNWNAVRFKPPPQFMTQEQQQAGDQGLIGWRVELRTPEIQLTDFENANCILLIAAIVQLVLEEKIELYIPLSLNDINMQRAAKLNSILNQRFWFRRNVSSDANDLSYAEMSIHSILFGERGPGDAASFESENGGGLLIRCKRLFERKHKEGTCSSDALKCFMDMFDFIHLRTSGELPTDAAFLRACLSAHPAYRSDSVVPPAAAYDICLLAMRIGNGVVEAPELLGPFARRSVQESCLDGKQHLKSSSTQQANCVHAAKSGTLLHGRGLVAASLRRPDIHERLRALMFVKLPDRAPCAKAESSCNGMAGNVRVYAGEETHARGQQQLRLAESLDFFLNAAAVRATVYLQQSPPLEPAELLLTSLVLSRNNLRRNRPALSEEE